MTYFFSAACASTVQYHLEPADVHVWLADLNQLVTQHLEIYTNRLSSDERIRSQRFHFERDRLHFIVTRGVLRTLLGLYLDCSPTVIQFQYGRWGKPTLAMQSNTPCVCFNVSHSHGLALFAMTINRSIGVDIEYLRQLDNLEAIAKRFFSVDEQAAILGLPLGSRKQAFFTCWTRKEAYIKATGAGLSMPLDQFSVSVHQDQLARILDINRNAAETARWSLYGLTPAANFVGALAVEGQGLELACRRWTN